MKVFCRDCKHFGSEYIPFHSYGECNHPTNIMIDQLADSWKSPGQSITRYLEHPSRINILNQYIFAFFEFLFL